MARSGHTVVTVEGGRELRRRLRRIEGGLDELKAEHRWIGSYVLGRSRAGTPHGATGRLAASGRSSGTNTFSVVRYGSARVPYAAVIHYGWPARHIQPHEWVVDAAQRSETVWVNHYNQTIERLVERTPGS